MPACMPQSRSLLPDGKANLPLCYTGSSVTSRLADLVQKMSPPAAADMLASMLTRDIVFKQLVLEAVDSNERMRLVVDLLQQV